MNTEQFTTDISNLEKFITELEKCHRYKLIGYALVPLIIGIFILRKVNTDIAQLFSQISSIEEKIIKDISSNLDNLQEQSQNILARDTYLIYTEKKTLLDKYNEYSHLLNRLLKYRKFISIRLHEFLSSSLKNCANIFTHIERYNKDFVNRRKKQYDYLFQKTPFPLDDDQKTAIITDDKHNLVVAGAGSGKTEVLTTRIAYLVARKPDTVDPNRILALAFQRNASDEIRNRLQERYGLDVKIKTFHSLGLEILKGASSPSELYGSDNHDRECRKLINNLFNDMIQNPPFQKDIIFLMEQIGGPEDIKEETDFLTKQEFYEYQRSLRYHALNGIEVKSLGEREIMNFFLTHTLNGKRVTIDYESYADWMSYIDEDGLKQTPKPDFFSPDYEIYIEHWSVDSDGNVPPWYERDYHTTMAIKKKKFTEQNKYDLLETTYGEFKDNPNFTETLEKRFLAVLKKKYPNQEFLFTQMDYNELVETVWEDCQAFVKVLPNNIWNFICIGKAYKLSPEKIEHRLRTEKWSPLQIAFSRVALHIYTEYQKKMNTENRIDFPDMINLAIDILHENKELYSDMFDQILIDEYQDISTQRYKLIKTLMDKNPKCKLFCVGDDWQSIMGFSGSNLDFFVNFDKYFNHPIRTDLKTNYRSIKSIVETSTDIIKHNGKLQLQKETLAKNTIEKPIKVFSLLHQENYKRRYYKQVAEHCKEQISKLLNDGCTSSDIMVLARIYNNPMFNEDFLDYAQQKGIRYTSVHASKGLQAKVVFILNLDKGLYGFPCELEDPTIYDPARETKIIDKEAEERRLFYVAVTRAKDDVIIYNQKCTESKFLQEIWSHVSNEEVPYNTNNSH